MNEKHENFVCWNGRGVGRRYAYILHGFGDLNSCWNLVYYGRNCIRNESGMN